MSTVSFDPRTGGVVATAEDTTAAEVHAAVDRAVAVADEVERVGPAVRAAWVNAVADAIEWHRAELVTLADRESGLGRDRLEGEVTRTVGQLRFYARVAVEGSYLGVVVDDSTEVSPHIVLMNRALGPVAVFGSSNFPFAFSVLGNDTASALAAGCPVIAKAHPAHVGLSIRLHEIAADALAVAGAPRRTLQLVIGYEAGVALVTAEGVAAVAFTGSQAGGLALWRIANEREIVIPVFAEMGTVNPVVVTRSAADTGLLARMAAGFVGSFTLGSGQYCTKPGLMLAPRGSGAAKLVADVLDAAAPAPVMLTEQIALGVEAGIQRFVDAGACVVTRTISGGPGWAASAAVLKVDAELLRPHSGLLDECFGAVVLVAEYDDQDELERIISALPGSLAATVVAVDGDPDASVCVHLLSSKVGRVTINDWPTGVAYVWAQQHGGPWPSTSSPAHTSVGAAALARFVRPVAYQSVPDDCLPVALRADNPWRLPRRVNGVVQPATA